MRFFSWFNALSVLSEDELCRNLSIKQISAETFKTTFWQEQKDSEGKHLHIAAKYKRSECESESERTMKYA